MSGSKLLSGSSLLLVPIPSNSQATPASPHRKLAVVIKQTILPSGLVCVKDQSPRLLDGQLEGAREPCSRPKLKTNAPLTFAVQAGSSRMSLSGPFAAEGGPKKAAPAITIVATAKAEMAAAIVANRAEGNTPCRRCPPICDIATPHSETTANNTSDQATYDIAC